MIIAIPDLLTPEQVSHARRLFDSTEWDDGAKTAGAIARKVKRNRQLDAENPVAREVGEMILSALPRNPLFMSAALPLRVLPPKFNRYEGGEHYGAHIDNAIMSGPQGRIRTDLSMTVFFSEPDEYDGGELKVIDTYGEKTGKLPAGHAILYTATSLHEVTPVTRGVRTSSFFWIQSTIRDDTRRNLLFDFDQNIQRLTAAHPEYPDIAKFTGTYHRLLQQWAEL